MVTNKRTKNQEQKNRIYIAIDLKSFYASVECRERGLDPLTTNLVVADESRTEKTICLAVSPSLKSFGVPGRPRLFEVIQKTKLINAQRARKAPGHHLAGESYDYTKLCNDPSLGVGYIVAQPRMAYYIEYSTRIYKIYLKYIAAEDIHVYSIDEVMIDVTDYLSMYRQTAHELAMTMIKDVLEQTGITATAGIGPNLYLAKVAMDIVAKHIPADEDGVRIAELDVHTYREKLWSHQPITDFWRIGKGYARRLAEKRLYTMGDVARCSIANEDVLFSLFGVNAELLIDHAWGIEPTEIKDIKAYKPENNSLCTGQVLKCGYTYQETRTVVTEMVDSLALDLVNKKKQTNQIVLHINYDADNLKRHNQYHGEISYDHYGRKVPKHAHGTTNLITYTSSVSIITKAVLELFDRIVDHDLLVRRLTLTANRILPNDEATRKNIELQQEPEQLNFFTDYQAREQQRKVAQQKAIQEQRLQQALLSIKDKYGKNAVIKGINLEEKSVGMERNNSIGGHHA